VTIEQFRTVYDAKPFRAFIIQMADGRSVSVPYRESLFLAPSGRTVFVYKRNDRVRVIDLALVTDLRIAPGRGRGQGGADHRRGDGAASLTGSRLAGPEQERPGQTGDSGAAAARDNALDKGGRGKDASGQLKRRKPGVA